MNTLLQEQSEVVILRHGRLRALVIVVVCVVAVAGLWSIRDQAGRVSTWVAITLFSGFGIFAGVLRLLPGASYLRLDPTGFTYCAAFFPVRVLWSDVAEFGVVPKDAARAYATVGFNFVSSYTKNPAGRALIKSIKGWESALPETYGKRVEKLADLMNEWLRQSHANV